MRVLNKVLYGEAPRSNPSPFYMSFLTEKVSLSFLLTNNTPITYLVKNFASQNVSSTFSRS